MCMSSRGGKDTCKCSGLGYCPSPSVWVWRPAAGRDERLRACRGCYSCGSILWGRCEMSRSKVVMRVGRQLHTGPWACVVAVSCRLSVPVCGATRQHNPRGDRQAVSGGAAWQAPTLTYRQRHQLGGTDLTGGVAAGDSVGQETQSSSEKFRDVLPLTIFVFGGSEEAIPGPSHAVGYIYCEGLNTYNNVYERPFCDPGGISIFRETTSEFVGFIIHCQLTRSSR